MPITATNSLRTSENDGAIFVIDTAAAKVIKNFKVGCGPATDQVLSSFESGQRPWHGVSPDGKTLYTANGPSNDVSVVDLTSQMVVKKIATAPGEYWCSLGIEYLNRIGLPLSTGVPP